MSVYYTKLDRNSTTNPKEVLTTSSHILHKRKSDYFDKTELANSFVTFFKDEIAKLKIKKVSDAMVNQNLTLPLLLFLFFQQLTKEDVRKLLSKSLTKFGYLTPIQPSSLRNALWSILLQSPILSFFPYTCISL